MHKKRKKKRKEVETNNNNQDICMSPIKKFDITREDGTVETVLVQPTVSPEDTAVVLEQSDGTVKRFVPAE